ncbi:MAG: phosphoribosylanthranilate isomerase [Candidatus Thermoplasmatota archaeon]|nr:phosphoribosylanthranilate isomerase [Candidatus Thermoplasmatota archaeon]
MKVKICGVTNLSDAVMCEDMGADAVGFVHFPGRLRSIPLGLISEICSTMGPLTTKVLVCAPSGQDHAVELASSCGVDAIQLYTMSPEQLNDIRETGVKVLRVIRPDRSLALEFVDSVDALVFEGGEPGMGTPYDYSSIPVDCCPRAIIAGGLNPTNLSLAKALRPYALDVSSGVERSPGKKDPNMVSEFVRRCKE